MTVPPAITAPPTVVLPPDKGWVERLLSPIADVRRGEATSTLLMSATMFVMLAGYYQLKTAREMFILSEGGAEVKSYSAAGQALLLVVLVPLYSACASRVSRTQLVQWVTAFFVANLLLFLLALKAGWRIGIPFFSFPLGTSKPPFHWSRLAIATTSHGFPSSCVCSFGYLTARRQPR